MSTVIRTNLCQYPSVEPAGTGWSIRTSCTGAPSTTSPIAGTQSYVATSTAVHFSFEAGAAGGVVIPVTSGKVYTVSIATKALDVALPDTKLVIDWWNGGSYLNSTTGGATNSPLNTPTRLFVTGIAPVNATRMSVYCIIYNNAIGNRIMADSALVEQSATAKPYFDGDTVSTALIEKYSWTGATGASVSVLTSYMEDSVVETSYPTVSKADAKRIALEKILGPNPVRTGTESLNDIKKAALEKVLTDNGQL